MEEVSIISFPYWNNESDTWMLKTNVGIMSFSNEEVRKKLQEIREQKASDGIYGVLGAIYCLMSEKFNSEED